MRRYRLAHLGLGGRGRRYIRPFQEAVHSSCVANALIGQEILEAIYKSAETMQRITLPLPPDDPGDRAIRLREIIPSLATEA